MEISQFSKIFAPLSLFPPSLRPSVRAEFECSMSVNGLKKGRKKEGKKERGILVWYLAARSFPVFRKRGRENASEYKRKEKKRDFTFVLLCSLDMSSQLSGEMKKAQQSLSFFIPRCKNEEDLKQMCLKAAELYRAWIQGVSFHRRKLLHNCCHFFKGPHSRSNPLQSVTPAASASFFSLCCGLFPFERKDPFFRWQIGFERLPNRERRECDAEWKALSLSLNTDLVRSARIYCLLYCDIQLFSLSLLHTHAHHMTRKQI